MITESLLESLCHHYDTLVMDENVPKLGYSTAKVSFALVISDDGVLSNIIDLKGDDKKSKYKDMDVPNQVSRANKIFPYFVCDNAKYVFGVEKLKLNDIPAEYTLLEQNDTDVTLVSSRSRECFDAFKTLNHSILDSTDDPGVHGFLEFLEGWKPEDFLENPKVKEHKDALLAGGNCVFKCGEDYLHRNIDVKTAWENYSQEEAVDKCPIQCLVSGKVEQISRVHQMVPGVVGANSAGASLVSFNDDAFCSYGKNQSFNSPVSESSMFKYTTTLKHLLSSDSNRTRIADATVIYWAEKAEKPCTELMKYICSSLGTENAAKKSTEGSVVQDHSKTKEIGEILNKVRIGKKVDQDTIGVDPQTKFYILGLSPSNARLAIRFWYVNSIGYFIERAAHHYLDMEIIRDAYDSYYPQYISIYHLLNETIPKTGKKEGDKNKRTVSPLLGGLIMDSIFNNKVYPISLYNAILNRVKVDGSLNYIKAGFIKAYLLRLSRAGLYNEREELITVSLNEASLNQPYRLGRLFAVLEKLQNDTNKTMNTTINDKYFSSAASTPAIVFPIVLRLAQHHISKSDWGVRYKILIQDILDGVDEFPAYLTLESQGMFMLGYYHQFKDMFKKIEEVPLTEKPDEVSSEEE